jgi:hypothetical protein
MRFVSLVNSIVGKTRRAVTQPASTQDMDPKDPAKLSETIRQLTARLNRVEAQLQPEATEFEVVCGSAGALIELCHGFKGPVRWYVVCWIQADGASYPAYSHILAQDSSSTSTSLFLRSYAPGRAVIRVERSQHYIDDGNVVANKYSEQLLSATFQTTAATAQTTSLSVTVNPGELWRVEYWGYSRCSTVNGTKYALLVPSGTAGGWLDSSTVNVAVANWTTQDMTANTLSTALHAGATNAFRRDQMVMWVRVGATGGTLAIQFCSATAGDTSQLQINSMARFTRIAEY